ncbi:MAG: SDR family oxidoreductase [Pseudomonadota bacterium]
MTATLICLGYGYVAARVAARARAAGYAVVGTTRGGEKAARMQEDGVAPIVWDGAGALPAELFDDAAGVLVSTPPGPDGCPALAAAQDALAARGPKTRWISYLSTNGVYGDHGGAWVDETAMLRPTSPRARRRIEAEARWTELGVAHAVPAVIFRLPGIYGPGRSALDTVRAGAARRVFKEGQVFSRAHVDDIAAAVFASFESPGAGDLFNVADDEPAPPQDVVAYACRLLGVEPPPLVPIDEADLSEMARSFYADNKRVRNTLMKEALGLALQYPTYRDGLDAIFAAEGARV